jgi:hypothetical protein
LNACVLLRRESIVATPDSLLSLALLRDWQRLSLGSLLMIVNNYIKPSKKGTIEITNKGLGFKLINSTSFGKSVFSAVFI